MGFDERDLRRALSDRSGPPSDGFRARLSERLVAGSRRCRWGGVETFAAAAAVVLAVASVAVLLGSRVTPSPARPAAVPTIDVGAMPTPTALPAAAADVESIQFLTPEIGWVAVGPPVAEFWPAGSDVLYATNDGGSHWRLQVHGVTGGLPLDQHMSFVSDQRGIAFVYGQELRTTDGGQRWTPVDPGFPVELVRSISFTGSGEGWALLAAAPDASCSARVAHVFHTADLGLTWTQLPATGLDDRQCKTEISFRDAQHGWITTQSADGTQRVFSSSDGGRTWRAFTLAGSGQVLHLPVMFDLKNGVLPAALPSGGGFGYYRTSDGGQTWGPLVVVPVTKGRDGVMWDFFNSTRWWVTAGPLVAWTSNAGATWTTADASALGIDRFLEFDVVSGQTIWALADDSGSGVVLRSDDGGVHWRAVAVG